jgi:nucleoside-diphosphate-sugar epimerase
MTSVAVLGASGFLGAHVVRAFLAGGWHVIAACRATSDHTRLPPTAPRLSVHAFDIATAATSTLWERQPAVVVNCTGYGVNPRETDIAAAVTVNATAIADLVARAAATGVRRFIHVGSAAEYGPCATPIDESAAPATAGTYATTKLAGSIIALQAALARNLDLCVVRPFGCYGPLENEEKFVPGLLAALRAGRPIDLTPGTQIRDYTYVADVADAIVGLAHADTRVAGQVINICSGVPLSIRRLGEALIDVVQADPALARWGARPARPGENPCLVGNGARLAALTGWRPTTSLADGLALTARAAAVPGRAAA